MFPLVLPMFAAHIPGRCFFYPDSIALIRPNSQGELGQ